MIVHAYKVRKVVSSQNLTVFNNCQLSTANSSLLCAIVMETRYYRNRQVAILLSLFSGKTAREIMQTDALSMLGEVQLQENLSRQRANGLASMVQRIHAEAKASMEPAN